MHPPGRRANEDRALRNRPRKICERCFPRQAVKARSEIMPRKKRRGPDLDHLETLHELLDQFAPRFNRPRFIGRPLARLRLDDDPRLRDRRDQLRRGIGLLIQTGLEHLDRRHRLHGAGLKAAGGVDGGDGAKCAHGVFRETGLRSRVSALPAGT